MLDKLVVDNAESKTSRNRKRKKVKVIQNEKIEIVEPLQVPIAEPNKRDPPTKINKNNKKEREIIH